jgi:hypothetical protein
VGRERRNVVLGDVHDSKGRVEEVNMPRDGDSLFHALDYTNPDKYLSVLECHTIVHKDFDATTISLTTEGCDLAASESAAAQAHQQAATPRAVGAGISHARNTPGPTIKRIYIGTAQGPVLRYEVPIHASFGEG